MMTEKIKKQKAHKSLSWKENLNLKNLNLNYKNWLEAAQIENKLNHLVKIKIGIDSLKVFVKNKEQILKAQQRFRSEKYNVFTEET